MPRLLHAFDDNAGNLRSKILSISVILIAANVSAWAWALLAFRHYPVLLGTAFLAYSLGLRHAVDADHIAAIDNVTRKLMQQGKQPVAVGFYFSLGHSSVVALASVGVALTATAFDKEMGAAHAVGGVIGTMVSAAFLLLLAVINLCVLVNVYRSFQRVKGGGSYREEDFDLLLAGGGLMTRLFRGLFRMIGRSWHMYPLGFLFGIGFDTATEIGLLGISAAGAASGMPIWSILVFPALFTAGMALIDTTDNVLMLRAYGWAFVNPIRKLYYNLTITFVSVVVAVVVGGIEALALIGDKLALTGGIWDVVAALSSRFGMLGYLIVAIFAASWIVSILIYRLKGYDRIEVRAPGS